MALDVLAHQLARAAYSTPENPAWCGCHVIASGNAKAIVAISESQQWVAIAGTDDPCDWLYNLDARLQPTPFGRVHRGFLAYLEQIRSLIESELIPSLPLHITGHSLGGAAASLLVPQLIDHGKPVASLTTFGAPRAGDVNLQTLLNSFRMTYRRHVNNNDAATRVPSTLRGFRHSGQLIYHSSRGKALTNPKPGVILADRIRGRLSAAWDGMTDGLADHRIERYARCLN